ncbi:SDR family NAD(P)-dependent oxidoreductase, partial [Myxococcota bacterium]|nr:SDR family NAD(P)-dependent oxidoreductase [Myxococcota bacterium]
MKRPVVIVAATSGIGRAIARRLAREGTPLILAGRNEAAAKRMAADCRTRFSVDTEVLVVDMLNPAEIQKLINRIEELAPRGIRGLITCQGAMPDQQELISEPRVFQSL